MSLSADEPQEAGRQVIGTQRRCFFGLRGRSNEPALQLFSKAEAGAFLKGGKRAAK
jgi:hypothetical protein